MVGGDRSVFLANSLYHAFISKRLIHAPYTPVGAPEIDAAWPEDHAKRRCKI
jgi:hypothetical protein